MSAFQPDVLHPINNNVVRPSAEITVEKDAVHDIEANSVDKEPEQHYQNGIERVRAITSIWSKTTLITMFILLYLIDFVDFLQNSVDSALNPYVTSAFASHGLLNVASVISTALGGCIPLTIAKVIDIWGRVEGFAFMLLLSVIGIIMKAVCKNVQTYIAAHVLYWAGHIGILYVVDVMCADMTTLKNRMIIYGINGTPRIAATFAGPKIADLYLKNSTFRWAFGTFAILLTASSIPAMALMIFMYSKAKKAGTINKQRSNRNIFQSFAYYFVQFDIIGILLIMLAFCLFLLPFTLVNYAPNGWKTGYIIAMIVLGILLFPTFVVWERNHAPVQFLPWKYLKEPTIVGSCLLYGVMFLSTFCWNGYFNSYLQVVHRQSVVHSGYILNSFSLTSSVFGPLIGMFISWSGNFKWTAYAGVPIMLIGTALLIPFRAPETAPGVLALTQVLVGLGTGIFAICAQLAVMAPVTHQEIAVVNAIWGLFGGFGSSIGFAIAGGLWNNLMPAQLSQRLPEESKHLAREIFGSMPKQMAYLDGTLERAAIVDSYSYVQRRMVITGACFVPLCLASIWIWKNINVRKLEEEQGKQTKGMVF
ncbi:siderophore iron transporter-like protein mirB [Aaosphaeria arxii CBS 175.79]|uniref:Siderophore iron transporter-like protein mirB n=1 Tax=Aaosphaeria arxii CBS 175.79 TaxID=1450172 RepID=A0A6A5XWC7_9PLEO|nr:siderophore iron transporter-like protein mirB [Aaosphaeria arxii CBS 175.79]KAF2017472.1 siderophore iron transporter-like protein mirB [Aaosphaeria arxii CBS 175.79]